MAKAPDALHAAPRVGTRRFAQPAGCNDGFTYKVVEDGGRFRFEYVRARKGVECPTDTLGDLLARLSGAWLDEVDPSAIESVDPGGEHACVKELACMVRELRDIVLR